MFDMSDRKQKIDSFCAKGKHNDLDVQSLHKYNSSYLKGELETRITVYFRFVKH